MKRLIAILTGKDQSINIDAREKRINATCNMIAINLEEELAKKDDELNAQMRKLAKGEVDETINAIANLLAEKDQILSKQEYLKKAQDFIYEEISVE